MRITTGFCLLFAVVLTVSTSHAERINPDTDLEYLGAFKLPDQDNDNYHWEYGGYSLGYRADGDTTGEDDGFPGSLFSAGKQTGGSVNKYVSEFTIPRPVNSSNLNDLNSATTLQPFGDITGGFIDDVLSGQQIPRMRGLVFLNTSLPENPQRIFWSFWSAYNVADVDLPSQGYSDPTIASPNAQGTWKLEGFHSKKSSGYLFEIPKTWADANIGGKYVGTGITRWGGAWCRGPGIFAIAPYQYSSASPPPDDSLPTTPLLYYDTDHDNFPDYKTNDEWRGASWLTAGDKEAVVFIGTKCLGDVCYGTAEHCGDGCGGGKGYHCYPRAPQIVFYDTEDLKRVAAGDLNPWDPVPYATRDLRDIIPHYSECSKTQGASYDRTNQILYVLQYQGDGTKPLIHVFSVSGEPSTHLPKAPRGLTTVGTQKNPKNNEVK